MIKTPLQSLTIGLFLLMFLTVLSCNEAPFEPPPNGPEGYGVYFYDESDNPKWYLYYPESDFLDSVILPVVAGFKGLVSPSGDKMFMLRNIGCGLDVVDLLSNELIDGVPDYCGGKLAQSPDGSMLVLGKNRLDIVRSSDLTKLYSDSMTGYSEVVFASDNETIRGIVFDGLKRRDVLVTSTVTNLEIKTSDTLLWNSWNVYASRVLLHPISDNGYVYGVTGITYKLFDWDIGADSLRYVDSVSRRSPFPPYAITNNGRFVVYTNPGGTALQPSDRPCEFRIYDTQLNDRADSVSTRIEVSPGDTVHFDVTDIVITPDSKFVVCISSHTQGNNNQVLVYNLETLKIERFREIPGDHRFTMILCQTGE